MASDAVPDVALSVLLLEPDILGAAPSNPTSQMLRLTALIVVILLVVVAAWLIIPWRGAAPEIAETGDPVHGEYILRLGGCITCHTDQSNGGAFLAGGRALSSPFGNFYTSNITPDPDTGIGGWSTGEFVRAMTEGISPAGHPYYPAFPYPSYTNMTRQDLVDLKAYLDTVEPIPNEIPDHDLGFPFGFRSSLKGWQLLFFEDGAYEPDPDRSPAWNRGAYIVNGPGHCGECHTPRNALGAPERDRYLGGTRDGPDGKPVPNITPHADGIGGWSRGDLVFAFQTSILPDGDVFGGAMGEVVKNGLSHLAKEDLEAIAEYLLTVEPLPDAPAPAADQPLQNG